MRSHPRAGRALCGRRFFHRQRNLMRILFSGGLVLVGLALFGTGVAWANPAEAATATPPLATPTPISPERLYGLWCISCHGDAMRGLTPEWIAKWPATHQNCWVAKCHGSNPPPDGFSLPKTAPAIAGSGALLKFRTAADLFVYVRAVMPYQEPGVLKDEQYYAILGYVLSRHGVEIPPEGLSAENAETIVVNPTSLETPASPEPTAAEPQSAPLTPVPPGSIGGRMDPVVAGVAVVLGACLGVALFLRRRRTPPSDAG